MNFQGEKSSSQEKHKELAKNLPFRVSYFMIDSLIDQQEGNDWVFINILAF